MTYVRWFTEMTIGEGEQVGDEAAGLGELIRAGLPAPPGFVVVRDAYLNSMERAGVRAELYSAHLDALSIVGDQEELAVRCAQLRELVARAGMSPHVLAAVRAALRALGAGLSLAVRSSVIGVPCAFSSGMYGTYANVRGFDDLTARIIGCWQSLFTPRAVVERVRLGSSTEPAMAVAVQRMIVAARSGVVWTADPATGDQDRIVVMATLGQGGVAGSGAVAPDRYLLVKDGFRLLRTRTGTRRALSDIEVIGVARLAMRAEEHFGTPQEIEWVREDGVTWLVLTRPCRGEERFLRADARARQPSG